MKIPITVSRSAVLLMVLVVSPVHAAAWQFNLPRGVTEVTHSLWWLHMMMFWVVVALGSGVFLVMLYSIIRHRKSRGVTPARFHENTAIEIIWTIIPVCILIAVAIPAAGTLLYVEDSSNADLTIRVTGYQWLWEYKYVDSGVHFYSRLCDSSMRARALESVAPNEVDHYLRCVTNRVVVPVHKKVRLLLTSGDVIHSWWVPKLAGKKDAIPGYINDLWFKAKKTGVYRGQCAELCGRGHGYMPIVVEVVTQEQFKEWIARKTSRASGKAANQGAAAESGHTGQKSAYTGIGTDAGTGANAQAAANAASAGSVTAASKGARKVAAARSAGMAPKSAVIASNSTGDAGQPSDGAGPL